MALFVLLVVGAVILGAGAMLAPAWHTRQPRIGLASTFSLALVAGGAVWWAFAFGWDTLVVDYLFFALLSGVVLGGTLSNAQARAEAEGGTLEDAEQGWTGPQDLFFFALLGLLIVVAVVRLAPMNTPASVVIASQTDRLLETRTYDVLSDAPTQAIFAPIFPTLTAYLQGQLEQPTPDVHLAMGGVLVFLLVWAAYDFGSEWHSKPLGRAIGLATLASGGMAWALLQGQYTVLMASMFLWAFITYGARVVRYRWAGDIVGAGLMLGAVIVSDFSVALVAIAFLIGGLVWAFAKSPSHLLRALLVLPVTAFAIAPFVLRVGGLVGSLGLLTISDMTLPLALISVPFSLLVGVALHHAYYWRTSQSLRALLYRVAYPIMAGVALLVGLFIWTAF